MNNNVPTNLQKKHRSLKDNMMIILGVLCGLYLLNPTFGMFEFLPDSIPIIGNLDEAAATTLLLYVFRYFGFDIGKFFIKK